METGDSMNPTTQIRDAILDSVSPTIDADDVLRGVEWAATQDVVLAARSRDARLLDFDEYQAVVEVAR